MQWRGARCHQELSAHECETFSTHHGESAFFSTINSATLPGPGCLISNQAVLFYYNTNVNSVTCGGGSFYDCVCVNAPKPTAALAAALAAAALAATKPASALTSALTSAS